MPPQRVQLLQKLKLELQYGDKKEIARRTGFSEVYVCNCLNHKNTAYNEEITDAAVNIVAHRRNRLQQQLENVKS